LSRVKYYYIILRENLLKRHRIKYGLHNRSTNTVKRFASQTNGNFLFLVRRLNILRAINQGPSRGFVTLVFLHVLNDPDVFRQLTVDHYRLFKRLKNVRAFYVYKYCTTTMLYYYSSNGDKRDFCCLRKRNDF